MRMRCPMRLWTRVRYTVGAQSVLARYVMRQKKGDGGRQKSRRELWKEFFFQGQPVTFSEEAFLAQKPGSPLQTFHKKAVHLQLFKQVRLRPRGGGGEGWAAYHWRRGLRGGARMGSFSLRARLRGKAGSFALGAESKVRN